MFIEEKNLNPSMQEAIKWPSAANFTIAYARFTSIGARIALREIEQQALVPLEVTPEVLENRKKFIALLRDRSEWPVGFVWDYTECQGCAMGLLGKTLLPISMLQTETIHEDQYTNGFAGPGKMSRFLGLSPEATEEVFWGTGDACGKEMEEVEPEDVAKVLEALP